MYYLLWMPNPDLCRDEVFTLAWSDVPERLFTKNAVKGLSWTCDGEGWTSETVFRDHGPHEVGEYYISFA